MQQQTIAKACVFSLRKKFRGEEVSHGFAAADEARGETVDENFSGARTRGVVGGLAHAVGSGVKEENQFAEFDGRKDAVACEKISRLADGANYVDLQLCLAGVGGLFDGHDFVVGM